MSQPSIESIPQHKSHRTRNILIIVIVLLVILVAAEASAPQSSTNPNSTSSTSSTTSSTSSASQGVAQITGYRFFANSTGPQLMSAPSCAPSQPSSGNFIAVKFTGPSTDTLTETSYTYGAKTVTRDFVGTGCQFQPDATVYLVFQNVGTGPYASVGEAFSGSLTLADGTVLQFSGTFQ